MTFHCDACNTTSTTVKVDGYWFGDRLLEGVMFLARQDNGQWLVEFEEPNHPYLDRLNKPAILAEARDFLQDGGSPVCSNCGEDLGDDLDDSSNP
jgi:hypothetical protein